MNESPQRRVVTGSSDDVVLLTLDQTCARTQLSRPSVVALIRAGRLKGTKVGTTWRISSASIESLTEAGDGEL